MASPGLRAGRLVIRRRIVPAHLPTCIRCLYATAPNPPALLSRLRDDLKNAMRSKDAPRLAVLRSVLADITNSSKTSSPIHDDLSLLSLLKKRISTSRTSVEQFYQADRKDLVAKEEEQLRVLEDYARQVKTMGEAEIRQMVTNLVESVKSDGRKVAMGDVMKRAFGPGGAFEGKMVEKTEVVRVIKDMLSGQPQQ